MGLIESAQNLDINTWLRGLLSAGISGGASAVVGGFTVSGMDPKDYNFSEPKFYILVGALFMTNAVVSVAKFLAAQPLPPVKQVEKTTQTITPATADTPKMVETIKETSIEPIAKEQQK
jgi:hypothetical protein